MKKIVIAIAIGWMIAGCGGNTTTHTIEGGAELPPVQSGTSITAGGDVSYVVLGDDATYVGCEAGQECSITIVSEATDSNSTDDNSTDGNSSR